jgi:O-methyltransferase involved in polyketide biosynthesis
MIFSRRWAGKTRADYFAVRTRFFDDFLVAAARPGCRWVVLLAEGQRDLARGSRRRG